MPAPRGALQIAAGERRSDRPRSPPAVRSRPARRRAVPRPGRDRRRGRLRRSSPRRARPISTVLRRVDSVRERLEQQRVVARVRVRSSARRARSRRRAEFEPSWAARRMRWASPPESVSALRSRREVAEPDGRRGTAAAAAPRRRSRARSSLRARAEAPARDRRRRTRRRSWRRARAAPPRTRTPRARGHEAACRRIRPQARSATYGRIGLGDHEPPPPAVVLALSA